MLRFMGSQRVGHDWATDLTDLQDPWFLVLQEEAVCTVLLD